MPNISFSDMQIRPNLPSGKPFLVWLSHDVDRLYKTFCHSLYYSVVERKMTHLTSHFKGAEPYWNFDRILDIESNYGVRSTFFFLNERMRPNISSPRTFVLGKGRYSILDQKVKEVIKRIDRIGWEVGLHGSYHSYNNEGLLSVEKEVLEDILGHRVHGVRQHYLNLSIPTTWKIHQSIGFQYDASFGLTSDIGFRDEVYYPFRPLGGEFTVFPLAIMDKPLFEKHRDFNGAWQDCLSFINLVEKKGTLLSVLWHQRVFDDHDFPGYVEIYRKIIQECQSRNAHFCTGQDVFRYVGN